MNGLQTLDDVFTKRIFKIPDYQRGYAWQKKQYIAFWEDLITLPEGRYHYTGMLSIRRVDSKQFCEWIDEKWLIDERSYKPFHVVDGQQRLTTAIILIQVIVEFFKKEAEKKSNSEDEILIGADTLKKIREKYLSELNPSNSIINAHIFGYEFDNPSFKYLKHKILNEPNGGVIEETFYTLNLKNSKKFFEENLVNYFKMNGIEGVTKIFKLLTQKFMFNVHEISDEFDVFVAFETMNNRGKQLSNLELLKNRLIYVSTLYEDRVLDVNARAALRRNINDSWREVYKQLGRNKENPLNDDEFLRAHWIMYFQYSRNSGDDYREFLLDKFFIPKNATEKINITVDSLEEVDLITDSELDEEFAISSVDINELPRSKLTPVEIDSYVNSLKQASSHWFNIHNPNLATGELTLDERKWLNKLNRLGFSYFKPLICSSFMAEKWTSTDRVELLIVIERFIFIAQRMSKASASWGSSEFSKAAREVLRGDTNPEKIIKRIDEYTDDYFYDSKKNKSEGSLYDISQFYKKMEAKFKEGNGYYGWGETKYFLYEYELELFEQRGNKKPDWSLFIKNQKDKISIEHVFPLNPNLEDWNKAFSEYSEEDLNYWKNTIGNLVPLSQSINSSLQNFSFSKKKNTIKNEKGDIIRHGYSNGSNSEIEISAYKDWTPETIRERGMKLIRFMERRWKLRFKDDNERIKILFIDFD